MEFRCVQFIAYDHDLSSPLDKAGCKDSRSTHTELRTGLLVEYVLMSSCRKIRR